MSQYDWLASGFEETKFVAFDTETTGLEPRSCRVVEIGGLRFDARGVSARFNTLVDPLVPMPPEVTRVNGITDAMLKGQPRHDVAIPDFLRFAGDAVLVAHNAPFDIAFVNEELARLGMPPLKNKVVDTRILARDAFPGLPNYKLQDLAVRFGITAVDAHRAEDDARVCMELFLACLAALRDKLHVVSRLAEAALAPARPAESGENAAPSAPADHDDALDDDGDDETFDGELDL